MKDRLVIKNIIASLVLQIVTMICGFITPKVIISSFGSSTNGLIASVSQFLNYVQLVEGGLGGVVLASLYKPLREKNQDKVSAVVNASSIFFRKIALIYVFYTLLVAVLYPSFIPTGYSFAYSVALTWILAINLFVQYFFSISYRLLLNADRKVYIISITQTCITLLNTVLVVVLVRICSDILLIKLLSAVIYFAQPIVFGTYVRKHYRINKCANPDKEALAHRWDAFGTNTAYFIHMNTDIVVITIFLSLTEVSVYSVYVMVVRALKNLIASVSQAIVPSMGNTLASSERVSMNRMFSVYTFVINALSFFSFTCGILLITPFIDIYTKNIVDANYHRVLFGVLILLSEMIYCIRDPYVQVVSAAGHFKQMAPFAYIEAGVNVVFSIVLVNWIGIVGVAIGTLLAMIIRMVFHVVYLKRNILYRNVSEFIKDLVCFLTSSGLSIVICRMCLDFYCESYLQWVFLAFRCAVVVVGSLAAMCIIFYRSELKMILMKLRGKRRPV